MAAKILQLFVTRVPLFLSKTLLSVNLAIIT